MQTFRLARALSRIEAIALLQQQGRAREFDRLLDHLADWADELGGMGLGLSHMLRQRDGALLLELDLSGQGRALRYSIQLDSIDCVFLLRERVRDYHALSAGALMPVLRERIRNWLEEPQPTGWMVRAG